MRYVMIAVGGALGAMARYQVGVFVQSRVAAGFPWGTFVVNMTACVIMGLASTLLAERVVGHPNWIFLIPVGFIGAYSTFSTLELDVFRAATEGAWLVGGVYVVSSIVLGYLSLWLGVIVARAI
jgi:CrcB protein